MSRSPVLSLVLSALVLSGTLAVGLPNAPLEGTGATMPGAPWPSLLAGGGAVEGAAWVHLRAGSFDPLSDAAPTVMGLSIVSSGGVYLVQFADRIPADAAGRLDALRVDVLGFVPEDALALAMPGPAAARALALWPDVRCVIAWQDGWKVHPSLDGPRAWDRLSVLAWDASTDLAPALEVAGARVEARLMDHYIVAAPREAIGDMASIPGVCWIEPYVTPTGLLDRTAVIVGARQEQNGDLQPGGTAVWSYKEPPDDTFQGLTGSTVTVDVTDSGVDGTHPAFMGRTRGFTSVEPGQPVWSDPTGHGTHVAGVVLGDGTFRAADTPSDSEGKYAGVAPGAYLLAQSIHGAEAISYRELTLWSVDHDADISQNSWGPVDSALWGGYSVTSRDYDNASRDADWTEPGNQPILVVFSSGNNGTYGPGTVQTAAAAKNVIAVGATGTGKNVTAEDQVWALSSRGPTDDGRIKPDLVAPGHVVTSNWAEDDDGSAGTVPPDGGTHSYITYGGTSLGAAAVSGCAALVIDDLRTNEGHDDPSPALVKAALIASADHLPGLEWPGSQQGWGRANASRAVVESQEGRLEWLDQSDKFTSEGETITYKYNVEAGTPLEVALVWTDLSSAVYTGKTLVNDLDLLVRDPLGTTYRGNVFNSGESTTGGSEDIANNVEVVYLTAPLPGEWEVTVSCSELPPVSGGGSQDFALAITGRVDKKFVDIEGQNLSVRAISAAEGDTVPVSFNVVNVGSLPGVDVPYRLLLQDEEGRTVETLVDASTDLAPGEGVKESLEWTAVRGRWTFLLVPNPQRTVREESYENNNASKEVFIWGFGMDAEVDNDYQGGLPGQERTFKVNITNTGNTLDTFVIDRSAPPTGWDARISSTVLEIQAGKRRSTDLLVTVAEGAAAGSVAVINVTVTSQGNSTYAKEVRTETVVLQRFDVLLDVTARNKEAAPGESADFHFSLYNQGNGPDTFSLSAIHTSGPTEGVTLDLPRTTFSLDQGGSEEGNLTISLDLAEKASLTSGQVIAFDLVARSVGNTDRASTVSGSLTISKLHAVSFLDPVPVSFAVDPDWDETFMLDLENSGNAAETVSVGADVPEGWMWEVDQAAITVEVGGSGVVQMTILVPEVAAEGEHTITVWAMNEDTVLLDSFNITFTVSWKPGLGVTVEGGFDRNLTAGEELTYTFWVSNLGNKADSVSISFEDLSQGLRASATPDSFSLTVGERKRVDVLFNASSDAELKRGTYAMVLTHHEEARQLRVHVNITIELADGPGPSNGGGGGGDDDEGIPMGLVYGAIGILVVVLVLVALMVFGRRRRAEVHMAEKFFLHDGEPSGARRETIAHAIQEESEVRRHPPRPPSDRPLPPPPSDEGEWVAEPGSGPAAAPAASAATAAPAAAGRSCPECGETLQPLGPGGDGAYCPMCGYQSGGGGGD